MLTELPSAESAARWLGERVRGSLWSDSRALRAGDGFIAWRGERHDARRFVADALRAGAGACLVDAAGSAGFGFDDARIAALPDLRRQAGAVAGEFFGRPSTRLSMVASTGTNGKTSTTWWTAQALQALHARCAVIGTLGVGEPPALDDTGLTTPDAVAMQRALHQLLAQGFSACAVEASSIGLQQHRLAGTHFDVALFTNLTQDHLDYHGTMTAYWAAKRALFDSPGLRSAVINIDDEHGAALAGELAGAGAARQLALWTCSVRRPASLRAGKLRYEADGLAFDVHEGAERAAVRSRLIGDFNVGNLLLVIGALRTLGHPLQAAAAVLSSLSPVPGRMQRVAAPAAAAPQVVVDYAHTPDALDKALRALRPFAAARGGRLWCVFGCGGNRDAVKRPLMGAIAVKRADEVVLTSDNPRDESAHAILAQILAGITGHGEVAVIEDRREAVADALRRCADADVVLIAGKGHEAWQEIKGVKRPFSDAAEAAAALQRRCGGGA